MISKTLSWLALAPLALLGMLIAGGLGYVYHLAHYWNPLIILSLFFPFLFGLLLVWISAKTVAVSRCESTVAGAIVGLGIGIAALGGKYWIPYEFTIAKEAQSFLEHNDTDLSYPEAKTILQEQVSLRDYLGARAEAGFGISRRGRSLPVGGNFMYVLWGIEAFIICLFSLIGGSGADEFV